MNKKIVGDLLGQSLKSQVKASVYNLVKELEQDIKEVLNTYVIDAPRKDAINKVAEILNDGVTELLADKKECQKPFVKYVLACYWCKYLFNQLLMNILGEIENGFNDELDEIEKQSAPFVKENYPYSTIKELAFAYHSDNLADLSKDLNAYAYDISKAEWRKREARAEIIQNSNGDTGIIKQIDILIQLSGLYPHFKNLSNEELEELILKGGKQYGK